jgi:PAS domain S-box-containing protein
LVDDNKANLLSLRAILEDLGRTLVEARSGEEALRRVQADEFAVVLLDVLMPGIGGFETAKLIRGRDHSRHTPIIFLTANDIDRPQLEEGYALGAVDFLVKPLLPIVLQAKVRGFVELFEDKQRALSEADQLRLLVHGTADSAIFMLDPVGCVVTWNAGAERLNGYTADEIIGQHFSRFYPPDAIAKDWPGHELEGARSTGRFEDDGWRLRKDGTRFWANVVITALRDKHGNLRGFSKVTRDLTARKQAEESLRRSEERFRLLVEGAKDYAIFLLDPEGRVASWNAGAERIKQYRADEIIGQHFSRFYPKDVVDRGWPAHELKVARAEGRFEDEGWRVRKDGTRFWANVIITALSDEAGVFRGFSKITRDLTERKRSEENARRLAEEAAARRVAEENARLIQEQRERLRVTLESIGDAVISTDAEGRVEFLNPVAEDLVGWKTAEAASRSLGDVFRIVNEETRRPVENPAIRALKEGVIVGLANHTVLIAKDGTERPIDDSAAPIRDAEGGVIGSVLVFRDISERKRAEIALRESEVRFRQLADAMPQIVWTARPDGEIDYLNHRWTEFTGLPVTVGNDGWGGILHPDDARLAGERWMACVQSGDPFEMETRLLDRRQQSYRWHLIRTVAVRDESGKVARWFGTSTEIHEQKRAAESSQYLAEASAALASVVDYESTLQKVANLAVPYFADWSAVDVAEDDGSLRRLAVAHQDADKVALVHELMREYPPDLESADGAFAVLRTGKPELISDITDELLVQAAKDDRHLRLIRSLGLKSYICVPLLVSGNPFGVLTFATAESGRKYTESDLALAVDLAHRAAVAVENTQLYQALRETDRRKDEFLATLAHELRNPLAPIRNSLQILKMPRLDAETVARSRDMMERQVQHLVRLVDDLLDVSRVMRGKIELRRECVELASIVAGAVETVQPLIDAQDHQLLVRLPSESVPIDADPVRLAQVVGNLLTNAAKYTEPGGRIELTAQRDGGVAVLRIRDNGIGIAPDMLPRIFELFVQAAHGTTRTQGGLGIGLTLVKNLVEMHDGTVEARSEGLGKGSEFVVRLPISAQPRAEDHEREVGRRGLQPLSPSGYRLLIVDDNQDAANSLAALLRLQGHEVRVAFSGIAALEIAKTYAPDLVFLDIGMPSMDGYEVARQLRQQPGLEDSILVALTGWGQREDRRRTAEAGFNHHLVKPPDPNTVANVLAELKRRAVK